VIASSTEALLGILKWVLLGLLYLFFARVLWAVWSEVRHTNPDAAPKRNEPAAATANGAPAADPQAPSPIVTVNRGATVAPPLPGLADPTQPAMPIPVPVPAGAPLLDTPTTRRDRKAAAKAAAHAAKQPKATKGRRGEIGRLVVLQPRATKGNAHALVGELSVGRGLGNTIVIADDTFASQVHARVFRGSGGVWVEDLGSTNGTFVNGARIVAAAQLSAGDRIQIGNTIFEAQ
jgi:hypothetical protein